MFHCRKSRLLTVWFMHLSEAYVTIYYISYVGANIYECCLMSAMDSALGAWCQADSYLKFSRRPKKSIIGEMILSYTWKSGDELVVWRKRKSRSFVGQKVPGGHVKHARLPHVCLYVAVTHKHASVNLKNCQLSDLTRMGFGAQNLNGDTSTWWYD